MLRYLMIATAFAAIALTGCEDQGPLDPEVDRMSALIQGKPVGPLTIEEEAALVLGVVSASSITGGSFDSAIKEIEDGIAKDGDPTSERAALRAALLAIKGDTDGYAKALDSLRRSASELVPRVEKMVEDLKTLDDYKSLPK